MSTCIASCSVRVCDSARNKDKGKEESFKVCNGRLSDDDGLPPCYCTLCSLAGCGWVLAERMPSPRVISDQQSEHFVHGCDTRSLEGVPWQMLSSTQAGLSCCRQWHCTRCVH